MFWREVDGALLRESVRQAKIVREAIKGSIDPKAVAEAWLQSGYDPQMVTSIDARLWAYENVKPANKPLYEALGNVYAIGYVMGKDVAGSAYARAKLDKAAPTEDALRNLFNIDWANWVAGNHPAEALARPKGALARLLKNRGVDIQGMNQTTLNRIGTQLANALKKGSTIEKLAQAILGVVSDPERALTIANTSMATAMSQSSLETYQEFGLEKMRWLALEPCDVCQANAAVGAVPPGFVFPSGQTSPAAHPNCRCALEPVVDMGLSLGTLQLSDDPDAVKYSDSQARDAHGRWASGGGNAALPIPQNGVISQHNLVTATAPHVGMTPKAKDVASRISDVKREPDLSSPAGDPQVTHTGIYTAKNGTKVNLVSKETTIKQPLSDDVWVEGAVSAFIDGKDVGSMNYSKIGGHHAADFTVPVSRIGMIGVKADYRGMAIGAAMLEFARMNSSTAVLHSAQLTPEGQTFAETMKYSDAQARDARGRWTSNGVSVTEIAGETDGFSVRGSDMARPTTGYMVARPEGGIVLDAPTKEAAAEGIRQFMAQHEQTFKNDPNVYFGGWTDTNTGKLYLELSDNVANREIAIDLGTRRDQVGIFDVVKLEVIETGGTGGARAEAGTSRNPDEIYGAGTIVSKAAGILFDDGRRAEGVVGADSRATFGRVDKKFNPDQPRDREGKWSSFGLPAGVDISGARMSPEVRNKIWDAVNNYEIGFDKFVRARAEKEYGKPYDELGQYEQNSLYQVYDENSGKWTHARRVFNETPEGKALQDAIKEQPLYKDAADMLAYNEDGTLGPRKMGELPEVDANGYGTGAPMPRMMEAMSVRQGITYADRMAQEGYPIKKTDAAGNLLRDENKHFITEKVVMTPEDARALTGDMMKELYEGATPTLVVSNKALRSILKDGRVKAYLEAERPSRAGRADEVYKNRRAVYENNAFGYSTSDDPSLRPISTYLTRKGDVFVPKELLDGYGGTRLVLKQSVKARTTITQGDSLNSWESPKPYSYYTSGKDYDYKIAGEIKVNGAAAGARAYKSVWDYGSPEAQIHGGITLADIEKVVFQEKVPDVIASTLDKKGIPYEVVPVEERNY